MFWVFKLSFVVDILAFLTWQLFGLFFKKFGEFFSDHLVTLLARDKHSSLFWCSIITKNITLFWRLQELNKPSLWCFLHQCFNQKLYHFIRLFTSVNWCQSYKTSFLHHLCSDEIVSAFVPDEYFPDCLIYDRQGLIWVEHYSVLQKV